MNYRGLKRAARERLAGSGIAYRKLALLFTICIVAVSVPCDVIVYLLDARLEHLSGLSATTSRARYLLWINLITIAVALLSQLWDVGFDAFSLRLSRGEKPGFRTFCAGFERFDRFLILLLLEGLYIFLWSMLFAIPGIIAAYRYRMAVYVLLDHPELTPSEAINVSKRLTYGHKLELFFLDLTFLWYELPSMLAVGFAAACEGGYLPGLTGPEAALAVELVTILLPGIMQTLFRPYRQTADANAYNWLLTLGEG